MVLGHEPAQYTAVFCIVVGTPGKKQAQLTMPFSGVSAELRPLAMGAMMSRSLSDASSVCKSTSAGNRATTQQCD